MSPEPYWQDEDGRVRLHLGDCLDVLPTIPDASIDAIVTDPPYGLEFMGKEWDAPWKTGNGFRRSHNPNDAGRDNVFGRASRKAPEYFAGRGFQQWCEQWATECLRVLKPGGHLLAFGSPRTYHRLAAGIEDAGFEIRDSIHWIYGSGMPKGQNIGKAIDRHRDDRADILRVTNWLRDAKDAAGWTNDRIDALFGLGGHMASHWTATGGKAAAVPTPQQWAVLRDAMGFDDTQILPLVETLNARKGDLGEAWERREVVGERANPTRKSTHLYGEYSGDGRITLPELDAAKRWAGWNTQLRPAHEPIILARKTTGFNTTVANVLEWGTGALNVDACRTAVSDASYDRAHGRGRADRSDYRVTAGSANDLGRWPTNVVLVHGPECVQTGTRTIRNLSGSVAGDEPSALIDAVYAERKRVPYVARETETVPVWACQPGCPVAEMDRQEPRASRFFPIFKYEGKAPSSERPRLADGTVHTTVKPLDLLRWMARLVTPPGGTILDPFVGSGTTLEAATLEGFRAIGIEREAQYADLCVARLSKPLQPTLFGDLGGAA